MAGQGPPPKHPSLRSRPHRASTRAVLPLGKPFDPGPLLRRGRSERPWHARTVGWWERVWDSPMAEEFLEVDVSSLQRLAELVDLFNHEPDQALAREIRLSEKRFGLSPLDRRFLVGPRSPRPQRAGPAPKKRRKDPRGVLRFPR